MLLSLPDGRGGRVPVNPDHVVAVLPHAHQGTRIQLVNGTEHHLLVDSEHVHRELGVKHSDVPTLEPVEVDPNGPESATFVAYDPRDGRIDELTRELELERDHAARVTAERDALQQRLADLAAEEAAQPAQ